MVMARILQCCCLVVIMKFAASSQLEDDDITLNLSQIPSGQSLLEYICKHFNISTDRCTCERFPKVCGIQEEFENNSSLVETYYERIPSTSIVYASVTIVSSLFGVIGNALVLIVAYKQGRDLQSGKLHIAELALVNLLFCIFQLVNVVPLYWTNQWLYGRPMCKLIRSLMEVTSFLTIGFVVIIAVERFLLVTYPLKRVAIEQNFRHSLVVGNVLLSIASVIPYSIGLDLDRDGRCAMFSNLMKELALPYHCFVMSVYFVIPVWLTTTIYMVIVRTIHKRKFSNSTAKDQQIRATKNRRIVLTTMLTLVAFVVCNLPTRVISMYLLSVNYKLDMDVYMGLVFFAYVTYPLQSTLNPILYSMTAIAWRKDMRSVAKTSGNRFMMFFRRVTGLREKFSEVTQTEF